jgi:hypothetical protein
MRAGCFAVGLGLGLAACSSDAARGDAANGGAAGAASVSTGGAPSASFVGSGGTGAGGGLPSSGGAGGVPAGAGVPSSGGVFAGGSTASGGAIAGGTTSSGGVTSAGGTTAIAGAPGAGGVEANLPNGVSYLFPPPDGTGVCPDAPLRIRFPGAAPTLGGAGHVQVHDDTGVVVANIDLSVATVTDSIGGTTFTLPRRAFVDGNDAVFYLKTKALGYGKAYYVTVDAAAVQPASGSFSISDSSTWRFTTKSAPPSSAALTVALDGSGDFCSVQGALDAIPANGTITVSAGTYHEVVHAKGKNGVTLQGADRKGTILAGTNNNNLNPSTSTRSLVGFDATTRLVVANLTIHNTTPQDGSQAEALRLQGCDQCVVHDADLLSLQDTVYWSGRVYAKNCYIEGNVDYVWGTGAVYFDSCELRAVGRPGVLVQSRNATGAYGYVFVNSKLTADAAAIGNYLGRIDASVYPGSQVAYVDCEMNAVAPAGWTITGAAPTAALRFWEYGSHDGSGNPVDVSRRVAGSTQISSAQAATLRDPSAVLGGWQPP